MLSDEFWAEVHQRTKHIEEMLGTLMAACDIKLQPSHAEDPSCPKVICIEEQPTTETLPSPLANPPGQRLTKTIATPKTNPPAHPLPKPTAPPQNDPAVQSLPKTTSPPPCKNQTKPISSQKEDQPPSSAQTPPQKPSSSATPTIASPQTRHKPHMLSSPSPNTHSPFNPHKASPPLIKPSPPKIPAKTEKNDSFWPKPKVQPPPTPPKFPPCSPIDQPRHQPPQSPATLFPISSAQQSPYLKTTSRQPQTQRTKPKKPPPPLRPYLFHTDWSRRRKRARFKTRHFLARRKPLAVSKFGVNGLGRGKKDTGWDKRGPKKKRQVRRANNRGFKFKVSAIRCSARKRLGKETSSWLRVAGTGQRQGAGIGRMGSDPEDPTERGSPPNGVSGHRRPPRRPPDGDYAKGGDSGLTHGSPEFSIEHRGELPRDFVMDAEITADDRQFPVSKVDRGACSGLTGGGRLKIGPEISGFFAAVEFNPESARGKWKEVAAGREETHVRAAGGVKSGHLVERKYGARSCYP